MWQRPLLGLSRKCAVLATHDFIVSRVVGVALATSKPAFGHKAWLAIDSGTYFEPLRPPLEKCEGLERVALHCKRTGAAVMLEWPRFCESWSEPTVVP